MCFDILEQKNLAQLIQDQDQFPEVSKRSYRRIMKPVLPRKVTSSARINLNKFWNELEEFYDRYEDRKTANNNNPVVQLPDWISDTYDMTRETAENGLNTQIESMMQEESECFADRVPIEKHYHREDYHRLQKSFPETRETHQRGRLQSLDLLDMEDIWSDHSEDEGSDYSITTPIYNPADSWNLFSWSDHRLPSPPKHNSLRDILRGSSFNL